MHLLPPLPRRPSSGATALSSPHSREISSNREVFSRARAQLLKQIARLTLLEHGLVTHALELDALFQGPAPPSKSKAAAAAAKARAADNVEDAEAGESTEETVDEFRARLDAFVHGALRAAKKGKGVGGIEHHGRDEYKESGTAFDVRRKVIAQFLKSLGAKRRCEHCGA